MKKNLKFVYTLLMILVFINCTAKDKDNIKSKQIYGNVQQDKTETIIQKQENDINLNDDQDPPVVLIDENTPETELIKLLESRKRHAWSLHEIQLEIDMYDVHGNSYEEFEKSSIDYLNRQKNTEIVKLDSDNKNIYCKQTLNLPSGKELIYDVVYSFYPYPKIFAYTNYELIDKPIVAYRHVPELKKIHGKMIEAAVDINENQNIKIFEKCINSRDTGGMLYRGIKQK